MSPEVPSAGKLVAELETDREKEIEKHFLKLLETEAKKPAHKRKKITKWAAEVDFHLCSTKGIKGTHLCKNCSKEIVPMEGESSTGEAFLKCPFCFKKSVIDKESAAADKIAKESRKKGTRQVNAHQKSSWKGWVIWLLLMAGGAGVIWFLRGRMGII